MTFDFNINHILWVVEVRIEGDFGKWKILICFKEYNVILLLVMDKLIIDKLIGYIRPTTYLVVQVSHQEKLIEKTTQVEADDVNEVAYQIWTKHKVCKEIIEILLDEVIANDKERFKEINSLIEGMSWHEGTWNFSFQEWLQEGYIDLYENPKNFPQPEIGQLVDFCLSKGFVDHTKLYNILVGTTNNLHTLDDCSFYRFFKIE
jgi:hypothetical protein